MFLGHFALAFAAKRAIPRTSLAVLLVAAQLADLVWPVFLALGLEQVAIEPGNTVVTPLNFISYPYSHSLVCLLAWGVGLALIYGRISGNRSAFVVIAGLVVSHWVLDVLTHRPDMPLYPGGPRLGLGLWNSLPATLAAELPLYAVGLLAYARLTRSRDRAGSLGFWALAAFLLIVYIANFFGPPPPSVAAIVGAGAVGGGALILWAWWIDKHRTVR
jgi:membrane-bound metal-dependent hydrolase YbcI (DUF457 family)